MFEFVFGQLPWLMLGSAGALLSYSLGSRHGRRGRCDHCHLTGQMDGMTHAIKYIRNGEVKLPSTERGEDRDDRIILLAHMLEQRAAKR